MIRNYRIPNYRPVFRLMWGRCRDGYEIRKDEHGVPWIHPLTANNEKIEPLEDTALFRRFADLHGADMGILGFSDPRVEAILGFVKDTGLDNCSGYGALKPDPLSKWVAAISSMSAGVNAWLRGDLESLAVRFNELNVGGQTNMAPQSGDSPPFLYCEPSSLFPALWVQLANAASNNLTQRQCDQCRRWYSPRTKRSKFCDTPCRTRKNYQDHLVNNLAKHPERKITLMRKHLSLSPRQYAHVVGCGLDAVYADIREGGINSFTIGKRKTRIPATAVEAKLHLEPGDLDPILDAMKG